MLGKAVPKEISHLKHAELGSQLTMCALGSQPWWMPRASGTLSLCWLCLHRPLFAKLSFTAARQVVTELPLSMSEKDGLEPYTGTPCFLTFLQILGMCLWSKPWEEGVLNVSVPHRFPQHLMRSFIWEVSVFQTLPFSMWWRWLLSQEAGLWVGREQRQWG